MEARIDLAIPDTAGVTSPVVSLPVANRTAARAVTSLQLRGGIPVVAVSEVKSAVLLKLGSRRMSLDRKHSLPRCKHLDRPQGPT